MTEKIPIPNSVLTLETLAARRAVQFVHEVGISSTIFEGDSGTSINALRKGQLFYCCLCLVRVKLFPENILFSGNAIFRKGKRFHVFGCHKIHFTEN